MIREIRKRLQTQEWLEDSFGILSKIAIISSNYANENEARELVIRVLEYRDRIPTDQIPIIDSLVAKMGLFPYADTRFLSTKDILAYEFNRPFNMDAEDIVFHSSQADIYRKLLDGESVILSAPTSYGKSLIIDSIIALNKFNNIAIIVPTIALIDETRQRLLKFRDSYKIITHREQNRAKKNIFVMTQERALSYKELKPIDFFVIDEFYKLSPSRDLERSYLLNKLFYELNKDRAQFYLLGPNVKSVTDTKAIELKYSFIQTDFATVVSEIQHVAPEPTADEAVLKICQRLSEPSLIFCGSPRSASELALYLLDNGLRAPNDELDDFIEWLSENYHPEWMLVRLLKYGMAVHHGRLPRSVAQLIIKCFNKGIIRYLLCTSTIIEGVNTSAKNVIIYDNSIARKKIDFFTFNNIKGRSGRMFKHFIGRVYILNDEPQQELPIVDIPIYTQGGDAPESLLVQIDFDDLTEGSKSKIAHLYKQGFLDVEIIKENAPIPPESQIAFAKKLLESPLDYHEALSWQHYPTSAQLYDISKIIWDDLGGNKKRSEIVKTAKQLAFKINQLREAKSISILIEGEIASGTLPSDAVENTLSFVRNWAEYSYPNFLRALNRIQAHVYSKLNLPFGNYDYFADELENLFMPPTVAALEEYGIPYQLTLKLSDVIDVNQGLDVVLDRLSVLSLDRLDGVTKFEKGILKGYLDPMFD